MDTLYPSVSQPTLDAYYTHNAETSLYLSIPRLRTRKQMYGVVFHDMSNFVRSESLVSLNCKSSEVIEVPRCYYTRWATGGGADGTEEANSSSSSKEDLIILENLCPQVKKKIMAGVITPGHVQERSILLYSTLNGLNFSEATREY